MADHDEPQVPELHGRLTGVAGRIDVAELEQARATVDGVVGRRRARKRVGATLGAAAVIATATTVVLTLGGGGPDTIVTTDDTMTTNPVPDHSLAGSDPTVDRPAAAEPIEVRAGGSRAGSVAGVSGAPQYGEWIVPWDDGFLVGSTSYPLQPLPAELPEEVIALFPQEVIDLFGGDLPDTIAEATDRLSETGLLEVVSDIIQENPAAYDAIYGAEVEALTFDVRYTVDGAVWEPREFVAPAGATYLSSVAAVGDRLAVVYGVVDPLTGMPVDGTITVATTSDLSTWTEQDIVVPSSGELPEGINRMVSAQDLAANDNGWVLPVYDSIDADPFSLLPQDVRDEIDAANGLGMGTSDTGVTVEYDFDADGNNPAVTRTFTWDELGVSPETAQLLLDQDDSSTVWAASWDGEPVLSQAPRAGGLVVATPAGFVQWTDQTWFSPDGVDWSSSPLPDGAAWVSDAFDIDGGLVVMSSTESGTTLVHRVDERGADAVLLDVPQIDTNSIVGDGSFSASSASGAIVTASPPVPSEQLLSVEVDGYRLSVRQPGGIFEVTDLATDEVIVSESLVRPGGDGGSLIIDDAGITVTDLTTGEVLVVFSQEVLDASESEFLDGGGGEYLPDFWLLASVDGERFVIDDLDDPTDGPTSMATNGTVLLLQSGNNWIVYDLD